MSLRNKPQSFHNGRVTQGLVLKDRIIRKSRVGHSVLFRSERYCTFFSVLKRERYGLFRYFLKILATYETQKNGPFFLKEWKRTRRTFRSFQKNGKECENVPFFCKRTGEGSVLFSRHI